MHCSVIAFIPVFVFILWSLLFTKPWSYCNVYTKLANVYLCCHIICSLFIALNNFPDFLVEFILNPVGKSDVCILHEYVQHAMRVQPCYIFKELGRLNIGPFKNEY